MHQWFFDKWTFWLMHRHFHHIRIRHNWTDQGGPLLLIGNHFSWWDGFIASYVNHKLFSRRIYVMMLEEELQQRKFLTRIGAFSIRKNTRSAIESIQYASKVLLEENNILLLYPQGHFQSLHQYPLCFEKGWFRILQQAPADTQLVFIASLTDYFSQRKPSLSIYVQEANKVFATHEEAELAYNSFFKHAISQQRES